MREGSRLERRSRHVTTKCDSAKRQTNGLPGQLFTTCCSRVRPQNPFLSTIYYEYERHSKCSPPKTPSPWPSPSNSNRPCVTQHPYKRESRSCSVLRLVRLGYLCTMVLKLKIAQRRKRGRSRLFNGEAASTVGAGGRSYIALSLSRSSHGLQKKRVTDCSLFFYYYYYFI